MSSESFALFQKIELLSDWSDLHFQRENNLRLLSKSYTRQKRPCRCSDKHPKNFGKITRSVIAVKQRDTNNYLILPIVYLGWRVRHCPFASLEIFELPLPTEFISELAHNDISNNNFANIIILPRDLYLSSNKPHEIITSSILWEARQAVVWDTMEKYPEFLSTSFSVCTSDTQISWQEELKKSLEVPPWEVNMQRIIPVINKSKKTFSYFTTFVITKRDILKLI